MNNLKGFNPKLYEILKNNEQTDAFIEEAKNGDNTLYLMRENKKVYFHSKYNPLTEAARICESFEPDDDVQHILFVGIGLGYHIPTILQQYPNAKFSLFEPNKSILKLFLEQFNLSRYKKRLLEIFESSLTIKNKQIFFKNFLDKSIEVVLPISKQLHQAEIDSFFEEISKVMDEKRYSMGVNAFLQKRWPINSIMNFSKVVSTPNLLVDLDRAKFQNKPAIIVAAGPSLAQDMDYIKKIKEEGRAYIFAAGSGVNALIANDIVPDAFFSVDPNPINKVVFENIKEKNLNIPLVFGSTIFFDTIINYPGNLVHFYLNEDNFSKFMLDYDNSLIVSDAVTVTNMTLQALLKLKMNPIIFAGQNLAYLNNRIYSRDIEYSHRDNNLTEAEQCNQKYTTSVTGEALATSENFLKMKLNLEYYLRENPNFTFINTTKNGANIEGAKFIPIEEVLDTILLDKEIVAKNCLEGENSVDTDVIKEKFKELEYGFDELMKLCNKNAEYLAEILKCNETGNYSQVEVYYSAFDKLLELIQDNVFFKILIRPMTRVQYENFVIKSTELISIKAPRIKVNKFNEIFGSYLKTIYATVVYIQPAFAELKKSDLFGKENSQ